MNRGLGTTLSTLFREAKGDVVVTIDADLSYDATHISRLLRALVTSGAAVVVASPYMAGGRTLAVPHDLEVRSRTANGYLGVMSTLQVGTFTGMVRAYDGVSFEAWDRFERRNRQCRDSNRGEQTRPSGQGDPGYIGLARKGKAAEALHPARQGGDARVADADPRWIPFLGQARPPSCQHVRGQIPRMCS